VPLASVSRDEVTKGASTTLDVPVDKSRQERFRLQCCLRSWTWMLCGIELPGSLLVVLAQELVRREKSREL
jgi:hypothetical protein